MSDDIVDRLKNGTKREQDAADEIERLRAENGRNAQARYKAECEVERLRAELAQEKRASEFIDSRYGDALTNLDRYRTALERLRQAGPWTTRGRGGSCE